MIDFNLYLITDRTQTAGRELPAVVADALASGVRSIQLREKDLSSSQQFELALQLRALTRVYNARLLINDRLDIALAVGADGVQIGANSLPLAEARRLLGSDMLIGYSAHALDEALRAEHEGADFVTFGPVFPTPSKLKYGAPLGLLQLSEVASSLRIPVFALGGIKDTSISEVMATGCHGVALISGIMSAVDPQKAATSLLEKIEKHATQR